MDNTEQINSILSKTIDLPTSKTTFWAILELSQNPDASVKDLENIIQNDTSLSAKVLKLVNSSYYGLKNPVVNVKIAIRLLGIGTIKTIALATSIFDFIGFEHIINKNGLWLHSWMVGFLSKTFAEKFSLPDKDTLFTAGLLHDIGKLILSKYLPVEYKLVLLQLETKDIDEITEITLEKECINFTHCYIGAMVLKKWHFPEKITYIVENHHNTDLDNMDNMELKLVAISNILANKYGFSFLKDKNYNYRNININKILNMTDENIDNILKKCKKNIPAFIYPEK